MPTPRRIALVLLAAIPFLAAPAIAAPATAAPLNSEYVALGDSFAAGPLVGVPDNVDPCLRSSENYAHLVAAAIHATVFRDVTCSGATTANILTTPQAGLLPGETVPIQLDAVTPTTTLVTLSIGANDIDLTSVAGACIQFTPPPLGTSCKATDTAGGVDRGAAAVDTAAAPIARTLDAIHAKAPNARILVTSYANYIQPGGCYPYQPIWPDDATYMQGLVTRLGDVTRAVAAQHNAEYVDFITPGIGHDGCQLTSSWATFVVPGLTLGLVPFHPTALGEQNFARIIETQLGD